MMSERKTEIPVQTRNGEYQRKFDIADMQCWVFRMAQSKWEISPSQCAELFKKYDIFGFISECYELLHVSSYACALEDVEDILQANGVNLKTMQRQKK